MKKSILYISSIVLSITLCLGMNGYVTQAQEVSGDDISVVLQNEPKSTTLSELDESKNDNTEGNNEDNSTDIEQNVKLVGWQEENGKWYYYDPDTGNKKTGWLHIGTTAYFLNNQGEMQTGWQEIGGSWYYFNDWGGMATGWIIPGDVWYYLNESGEMQTGWQKIGGSWYYFNDWGGMETGWIMPEDVWYFLNESGRMETGWQEIGGSWYYFNDWGGMAKGWIQPYNVWYYLNASGRMETGWQEIGGSWYYFNDWGGMETGWIKPYSVWYYLNASGRMETGWQEIGGSWYYFNEWGGMETGWIQPGSVWYYLNASGRMVTGWQEIGGSWYYFNEWGGMETGWVIIDETWFYFKSNGAWDSEQSFSIETIKDKVKKEVSKYSGSIGVYFEDLKTGNKFTINDISMYPCSIIKMTTMASVYNEINLGNLTHAGCDNDLWNMMVYSDNTSYNRLMAKIGQGNAVTGSRKVNSFLKENGINYTAANNGLQPGSGYFTAGPRNYTCPSDIGLLLSKIYNKRIVSTDSCDKMIDLMSNCADNRALRRGLPNGTKFAHKSGWAYDYYHDGGIIFGPTRDYILVVFTQGVSNYGRIFENISSLVYDYEKSVW